MYFLNSMCELQVDAVQACGGQKTSLGDRFRSGGGILWNILKTRDPSAYKEIMKKGNDFQVHIVVILSYKIFQNRSVVSLVSYILFFANCRNNLGGR